MAQNETVEIDNEEGYSNAQVQGWMLVFCQVLVLMAHAFIGFAAWPWPVVTYVLLVIGLGLSAWSAISMRTSLTPSPLPNGQGLIEAGPFRWLRHPLYLGLILAAVGIQLASDQTRTWYLFGLLVLILLTKMQIEDSELAKTYPNYQDYKRRTKRLIPFVF